MELALQIIVSIGVVYGSARIYIDLQKLQNDHVPTEQNEFMDSDSGATPSMDIERQAS
jgi:hypothetical protein